MPENNHRSVFKWHKLGSGLVPHPELLLIPWICCTGSAGCNRQAGSALLCQVPVSNKSRGFSCFVVGFFPFFFFHND